MRSAKQKEMFEISDMRRREILLLKSVCPLVPLHTSVPGYFLGFKVLNFNIFWGMKVLWIFFGSS